MGNENLNEYEFDCFLSSIRCRTKIDIHKHFNFHELYYAVDNGGYQFLSKNRRIKMRKGDLFFYPVSHLHISNGESGKLVRSMVVYLGRKMFSPDIPGESDAYNIVDMLCRRAEDGNYLVPLKPSGRKTVGKLMLKLVEAQKNRSPGIMLYSRIVIQQILLAILNEGGWPGDMNMSFSRITGETRIKRACRYIDTHYNRKLTVSDIANVVNMSRSHLHAVFYRETGKTLTEYINEARCNAAIKLLGNNEKSIEQIAAESGFSSVSNFYRAFREQIGSPPADFRKS